MTSYQVACAGCGNIISRTRPSGEGEYPPKCFDCKKKRQAENWKKRKQLMHRTIPTQTIEKNQKVV